MTAHPPLRGHRRVVVMAAALTTAVMAVAAACDSSAANSGTASGKETATAEHEHRQDGKERVFGETAGGEAESADDVLDLTATDFDFAVETEHVTAGALKVRLANEGSEAHQVHIGRAHDGIGVAEFLHTFETQSEAAAFTLADWVGGVAGVEPGKTAQTTVDLAPGDYLLVCYLPSHDGHSHVTKKMVRKLHVGERPPTSPTPEQPKADATIRLVDFQIELPAGFTGKGAVAVTNEGAEPHEFALVKLLPGKTLSDAAGWQAGSGQPAPFTFEGGAGTIEPGATEVMAMDLSPGDYIATCAVTGAAGMPHMQMGMIKPFTIS